MAGSGSAPQTAGPCESGSRLKACHPRPLLLVQVLNEYYATVDSQVAMETQVGRQQAPLTVGQRSGAWARRATLCLRCVHAPCWLFISCAGLPPSCPHLRCTRRHPPQVERAGNDDGAGTSAGGAAQGAAAGAGGAERGTSGTGEPAGAAGDEEISPAADEAPLVGSGGTTGAAGAIGEPGED